MGVPDLGAGIYGVGKNREPGAMQAGHIGSLEGIDIDANRRVLIQLILSGTPQLTGMSEVAHQVRRAGTLRSKGRRHFVQHRGGETQETDPLTHTCRCGQELCSTGLGAFAIAAALAVAPVGLDLQQQPGS